MIILIDSNSICHAVKHSLKELTYDEQSVYIIYGFMRQLLALAKTFKTNKFIFVWDSRKSLRKEIFPDYKKTRRREDKTIEEIRLDDIAYTQFNMLRKKIIPELGFKNSFMVDGYEADDIIAQIIKQNPKEEIVIISADEDLYQLLSDTVTIYSIKKKREYTNKNLWKDYRITPIEWGTVKAIAGCSTDDVPGVPSVGEATACKYLTKQLPKTYKAFKVIEDNKKLIEFNKQLVVLPLKGTPKVSLVDKDDLDVKKFITISQRYGFNSFTTKENLAQWKEHIFTGKLFN